MGPHISNLKVRRRFLAHYLPLALTDCLYILQNCGTTVTHARKLTYGTYNCRSEGLPYQVQTLVMVYSLSS